MTKTGDKLTLAVGLMSGTSCDGVDAALIEADGVDVVRPIAFCFRPYSEAEKGLLKQALDDGKGLEDRNARPGCLAEAETMVTTAHREAVEQLLALEEAAGRKPDLIGFHGQTVWHDAQAGVTVQIGDGQALSDGCGVPVIHDFRAADVAAGGQGAPLVPIYHKALQASFSIPLSKPLAVINIGGVANVTWIGADDSLTAFDSGPGNALINDWVLEHGKGDMDEGGAIAAAGTVDFMALLQMMANPYFRQEAPKSLDRNGFDLQPVSQMSLENGAATLTAFTVETICLALEHMSIREGETAKAAIVCGGGRHNGHMMRQLSEALDVPLMMAEELGWRGDALEAEAFAYLAVRSQKRLPITYPGTTGVDEPMTGGLLAEPLKP